MEGYVIIGIVFTIHIIIFMFYLIKNKVSSRESDKLFELWKEFKQSELIPSDIEGSNEMNAIYKQYFNLKYPDTMISVYHNHCWNCKRAINSRVHLECPKCGWYICDKCGACNCQYGKEFLKIYQNEISKMINRSDDSYIKKRFSLMESVKRRQSEYLLSYKQRPLDTYHIEELVNIASDLSINYDEYEKIKGEFLNELEVEKEYERLKVRRESDTREEINNIKKMFSYSFFDSFIPQFVNLENELDYWQSKIKDLESMKEKQKKEEERKYRASFKYIYDEILSGDKHIIKYSEYSHKVDLLVSVMEIDDNNISSYLNELIDKSEGFLLVMTVIVNNESKKSTVKKLSHMRIQKVTCYSNEPQEVRLLIEPK